VPIRKESFSFLTLGSAVHLESPGLEESLHPHEDAVFVIDHQKSALHDHSNSNSRAVQTVVRKSLSHSPSLPRRPGVFPIPEEDFQRLRSVGPWP
jgi:hypothetical protein